VLCQGLTDGAEVLRRLLSRFDPIRRVPAVSELGRLVDLAEATLRDKAALVVLENVEPALPITQVLAPLQAVARCEKEMQEWGGAHISAERSQPYYLDITHPEANKGEVVLMLSKLLSIPPEQIVTIGNMPNDVLMFNKSGVSIAMGNASAEVQKTATYVTTSNDDKGFANAMERFVLGES
jgi:hydroxymethylpyrimidine pyrophosphatase-like HAD family hydrolase